MPLGSSATRAQPLCQSWSPARMMLITCEAAKNIKTSSMQDLFYDKMMADDRVNFFFKGVDMKKQRAHQVSYPA